MLLRFLVFTILAVTARAVEPREISAELDALRAKYKVPACAAAVVEGGRVTSIGASGVRRVDSDVRVTTDDIWHIGSCTKSMTAALVGVLVDAGKLRWDMPVSDALPGMPCHDDWRKVTLWDVVTQRSGLAVFHRPDWRTTGAGDGSSPREQRASLARLILSEAPAEPLGKFAYSNSGYGLLGAILEQAADDSYEELLRKHIFAPLGLKTAGFGAPATQGKLDQPWGHSFAGDRPTPIPIEPIPGNQFPLALAPAGCVHMSLTDFARYAAWLSTGEPVLVKAETFARLQTPPEGSSYAGGLWKTVLPTVGGEALCHTGRMGGFSAVFYAGRHIAVVAVFNVGDGGWEWLGDEIAATALRAGR